MLDLSHLPPNADVWTVQIPRGAGTESNRIWTKPRGAQWVYILALGAGGNGGNGSSGAGGSTAGGASGSSGAQTMSLLPACHVPAFLTVGLVPGALNSTGVAVMWLSATPAGLSSFDLVSYANHGGDGNNASGTTAGAGNWGGGSSVSLPAGNVIGNVLSIGGDAPLNGSSTGAGSSTAHPATSSRVRSGGSGASSEAAGGGYAGGSVTATDGLITVAGGAAGANPSGDGGDGGNGYFVLVPLTLMGGAGGGSAGSAGGNGGKGGDGAPGCGGGGGGGGVVGGAGGVGGPAFVMIVSW